MYLLSCDMPISDILHSYWGCLKFKIDVSWCLPITHINLCKQFSDLTSVNTFVNLGHTVFQNAGLSVVWSLADDLCSKSRSCLLHLVFLS